MTSSAIDDMKRMSGLEFLSRIADGRASQPPIGKVLGFRLAEVSPGFALFTMTPGSQHYNPIGVVHGGIAGILLDSCMGCAVQSHLPAGTGYTTLEFKISFIKGMTEHTGPVRSEGKTLSVGRRAATAEARITDAKGRLLAHATTTCLVFEIPKGT
jgi:uncharacterized protein (TIGR00369 family)